MTWTCPHCGKENETFIFRPDFVKCSRCKVCQLAYTLKPNSEVVEELADIVRSAFNNGGKQNG